MFELRAKTLKLLLQKLVGGAEALQRKGAHETTELATLYARTRAHQPSPISTSDTKEQKGPPT
jgi:hypothetical protein